jgi:hypothetical protein
LDLHSGIVLESENLAGEITPVTVRSYSVSKQLINKGFLDISLGEKR